MNITFFFLCLMTTSSCVENAEYVYSTKYNNGFHVFVDELKVLDESLELRFVVRNESHRDICISRDIIERTDSLQVHPSLRYRNGEQVPDIERGFIPPPNISNKSRIGIGREKILHFDILNTQNIDRDRVLKDRLISGNLKLMVFDCEGNVSSYVGSGWVEITVVSS